MNLFLNLTVLLTLMAIVVGIVILTIYFPVTTISIIIVCLFVAISNGGNKSDT